ncbi:MAG: PBP1A family penicillin-binding protein [Myxococcota bacterium]|nr:PBP1A family penicillin-binding protein [Myxococcota bacterium]
MAFARFRIGRIIVVTLLLFGLAGVAGGLWFYDEFLRGLPDLRRIEDYRPPVTSVVLDRKGRISGEFYEEKRRLVPIGEIPAAVQLAFVAAEDKSFFQHRGLDYSSILRAAMANLRGGGIKQGASTITQQTVKSLLLSPERTFRRKIREMILALQIEQRFSKDEILYLYVNQIYFGHGAWGIGQAARDYFGKPVSDLTLSEAALLAGLPQRPSDYSPYASMDSADKRRRYVLGRMLVDGFIGQDAYDEAIEESPEIRGHPDDENLGPAAHFVELVRRRLFEELGGEQVLTEGLVIETTLDLDLQRSAVEALRKGLEAHDHRQGYRGPVRHVEREAVAAEIIELGQSNARSLGLDASLFASLTPPPLPEVPLEEDEEVILPQVTLEPRPEIPAGEVFEAVVTRIDPETQTAHVSLAPGLEGVVHLDDVKWAREADPKRRPYAVRNIETIFEIGDVALFTALEGEPSEESETEDALPRMTLFQSPIVQGALISFENDNGHVFSLVGGYDYTRSEFNRATQAKRQPGSAFKPLIYGAAFEKGYTPVSEVVDRPVVYTDPVSGFIWAPRNYGRHFFGPMPMRNALKKSINNATVHLFRDIGVDFVIDYARRFGIQSPLSRDLSLALGSSSMTLLEITAAYGVFPNRGHRVTPIFVNRVIGPHGQTLLENLPLGPTPPPLEDMPQLASLLEDVEEIAPEPDEGTDQVAMEIIETQSEDTEILRVAEEVEESKPDDRVVTEAAAYLMSDLMKAVVQEGTGRKLRRLGRPLAGKTGTTNDQGDAWFVGFSPEFTTGVWVGHDDNRVLGFGETGAGAALPIWSDFMEAALEGLPIRDFEVPSERIVFRRIDRETGLLANANTRNAYFQPFLEGTEPQKSVSQRESASDARQALLEDVF